MDDYRYKALQTLTRARFYAVQDLTREKQRFANYLFLKCSGLAQDKDIKNTSATTIALMERFETADELAYMASPVRMSYSISSFASNLYFGEAVAFIQPAERYRSS